MKNILSVLVVALAAGAVVYGVVSWQGGNPGSTPEPTASSTPDASATPTPQASATPRPSPIAFIGPTGLKAPASCTLGGSIDFMEPTLSASNGAAIAWKNVDIKSRLINWRVSPSDDLSVGPNIFANLTVPNGSDSLTVGLPQQPKARAYQLFASVTYGQMVNGNVVVKETPCSGTIAVTLSY